MNDHIWLPGAGRVPLHMRAAAEAVKHYDSDLVLGKDQGTEEWVVFLTTGPEGQPFPVFHLGRELPAPEAIQKRLYLADVRRRGREIVATVERKNAMRRKELDAAAHEAAGEAAEVIDWALRKDGKHPSPRIFVPGKD